MRAVTYFVVGLIWIATVQASELSQEDQEKYRDVFDKIDGDKSGKISTVELTSYLNKNMGTKLSKEQVTELIKTVDKDNDGEIDSSEFLEFVKLYVIENKVSEEEKEQGLRRMFDNAAKSRDTIGVDEFKLLMRNVGIQKSDEDIAKIFEKVDTNNDGSISFEEFKAMTLPQKTQEEESKKAPAETSGGTEIKPQDN